MSLAPNHVAPYRLPARPIRRGRFPVAMRWWQWHAVPVVLAVATMSCSAPSTPAAPAGTPVPATPPAQSTIPARATTAVAVAVAGPTQPPTTGAPVRPTVTDTSFKGGPLPTARAGAFGEPTAVPVPTRVVGIAKIPLKEVAVGMWCTNAEQSITGSTMQCLALTADGIFSLGVVIDGNVYSQSVVSGTFVASDTEVTLRTTQRPAESMTYDGSGEEPALFDRSGRFAFHPYGRPPAEAP